MISSGDSPEIAGFISMYFASECNNFDTLENEDIYGAKPR
jgi:hypothetical protein